MPRIKKQTEEKIEVKTAKKSAEASVDVATNDQSPSTNPITTDQPASPTGGLLITPKDSAKQPKITKPEKGYFFGTGRRKTATARARLYLPTQEVVIGGKKLERGEVYVNGKPIESYFSGPYSKSLYTEAYRTTNTIGRFITTVVTSGSGQTGQLGATVLAISRALCAVDPRFQPILRKRGFLTRDPRMKERKKPGLMGARKQKSSPKR